MRFLAEEIVLICVLFFTATSGSFTHALYANYFKKKKKKKLFQLAFIFLGIVLQMNFSGLSTVLLNGSRKCVSLSFSLKFINKKPLKNTIVFTEKNL